MHPKSQRAGYHSDCFNPRPAVRPGDADITDAVAYTYQQVSIRARP